MQIDINQFLANYLLPLMFGAVFVEQIEQIEATPIEVNGSEAPLAAGIQSLPDQTKPNQHP